MQATIFFIFEPTPELAQAAKAAGQDYLAQRAVWLVREHDRVGAEHAAEELSRAHWLQFVANLEGDENESDKLTQLRAECLSLGFAGCWKVFQTKTGGDAQELLDEGRSAEAFLASRGAIPT